MNFSARKIDRNNNQSDARMMKTVKLSDSHDGLNKILNSGRKSMTYRTSMPRYAHNEDVFKQVPYVKPTISGTRKSFSIIARGADDSRPSPCFLTLNRDLQKQNIFTDQYDGPSSLITASPERKTDMIKSKTRNPYQEEREEFKQSFSATNFGATGNFERSNSPSQTLFPEISRKSVVLPEGNNLLKNSKQQYQQFLQEKQDLNNFQELKGKKNFINKRDRLMKNGWRHGVVGVENPLNPDSEVYNEIHQTQMTKKINKDFINNRRKKSLNRNLHGVDKSIDIDHQWKSKKSSPERFKSTFNNIFESHVPSKREIMAARRLKVDI